MTFTPSTYTPFPWQNAPSTATPINASNLQTVEANLAAHIASIIEAYDAYAEPKFGGNGGCVTVAASDTPIILTNGATYFCTGTNDDQVITEAANSLGYSGGRVVLLPGDYYLGNTSTSFINVINQYGGITLQGSGRRQGSIIHVPQGSAAPCAVRAASYGGGSHTVRDLYVEFDGNPSGGTHGVWMQCNEPQVYNCAVSSAAGHGFICDGAPTSLTTSVTAPTARTYSGNVVGCEVYAAGSGLLTGGSPADGFVTNTLCENTVFNSCFVDGGAGYASGVITAQLTNGTTYNQISTTPMTNTISSGSQIIIVDASVNPVPAYQLANLTAAVSEGDTTIHVSFTANHTFQASNECFVASTNEMTTRNGFSLLGGGHLDNCHPYYCHLSGVFGFECPVYINGGEYETNGWENVYVVGSTFAEAAPGDPAAPIQIVGATMYGNAPGGCIYGFALTPGLIASNSIDAGTGINGIFLQSANGTVVTGNTLLNGVTPTNGQSFGIQLLNSNGCSITGNALSNNLSASGTHYGISLYNTTDSNVESNNLTGITGTPVAIAGTSTGSYFKNNLGANPVGVLSVTVPATTVPVSAAFFDRTFYVTAGSSSCTLVISGGPTITVPSNSLATIRVPAGCTLTPTYTSAPTWVVEGE